MPGKYEQNEDETLAEALHTATMEGTCEEGGSVDSPIGWFALVEDFRDADDGVTFHGTAHAVDIP